MKKRLKFFLGSLLLLGHLAWAADVAPLVFLPREAMEGMVWDLNPITLGSRSFQGSLQGIGSPGATGIGYAVKGEWELLEAYVGYVKNVSPKRVCRFFVQADGQTIFRSEEIHGGQEPELIRVPIQGKKIIMLGIEQVSYGSTLGACYAQPELKRGLSPEEMMQPYNIEVNGQKVPYTQYQAPKTVPVDLPVKPGESVYQVKVTHDDKGRRIIITTTP